MDIIFFIVPITVVLMVIACFAFYFAVKNRQYDDLEGDANRIVLDDRQLMRSIEEESKQQEDSPASKD